MDKRWQMVLDCLGAEQPPFSQGTLFNFRMRLIAHNLDKTLLDRTVALAEKTGGFGARQLRAALDSTPLIMIEASPLSIPQWYAGRGKTGCQRRRSPQALRHQPTAIGLW